MYEFSTLKIAWTMSDKTKILDCFGCSILQWPNYRSLMRIYEDVGIRAFMKLVLCRKKTSDHNLLYL